MTKKTKFTRGTELHTPNKFFQNNRVEMEEWKADELPGEEQPGLKTKFVEVTAKSMINTVSSPDVYMDYSVNPYQGCEHGCVYCYARPTHNYWGYSAGDEFEQVVLVKTNALEVLKAELNKRNHVVKPLVLSGNTDCYQPAERKYRITRGILDLMLEWKHPVSIITKNALIIRDLDLLESLNSLNLCSVAVSVTASNDDTRRIMEPRASTIESRLKTIRSLSDKGIPVHAMLAPIIPGINDAEISRMVKLVAENGAQSASYQVVRLNQDVEAIFDNWLDKAFPDRKTKVLNAIKSFHKGQLADHEFGHRMKGSGPLSEILRQHFKVACSKYLKPLDSKPLRTDLFHPVRNGQLRLWS